MREETGNFAFLSAHSPQLAKLGRLAERYFADDPPATLVKPRQFSELVAKDVAARQALLVDSRMSFDDIRRMHPCRRESHCRRSGPHTADDCDRLADLMIEHGVRVRVARAVELKRLDEDLFVEE